MAHDNIEDSLWHDAVFSWNASTRTLSYSLDGVAIDSKTYDVVATDWTGNPNGYFGFTGGTGTLNQQQVEIISVQVGGTTTVAENSASGTVVGVATAVDPDRTGTVTYSLTDTAGGRFSINSTTGQITVASGAVLDYEVNTSHKVVVQTTDQGGLIYSKTLTINVSNVNEAPVDLSTAVQNISVTNYSFEADSFADGASSGIATGSDRNQCWKSKSKYNHVCTGIGTDGTNMAYVNIGGSLSQTLSANFDSNLNYHLTVDVGRRLDTNAVAYGVKLYAGATLIGSYLSATNDTGAWSTVNVKVIGASYAAANGGALTIVLTSASTQTDFDNVQLTSTSATASIAENSTNGTVCSDHCWPGSRRR